MLTTASEVKKIKEGTAFALCFRLYLGFIQLAGQKTANQLIIKMAVMAWII